MDRVVKWRKCGDVLTSECETIVVTPVDEGYVLSDEIEGEKVSYKTQQEALDQGGKRVMMTRLKNFYVFADKLDVEHQITD